MRVFMAWMNHRLQSPSKSQSTPTSSQRIKCELITLTPIIKCEPDIISLTDSDGSSVVEFIGVPSTVVPQRHRKVKKRRRNLSLTDSKGSDSEVLEKPSNAAPPWRRRKTAPSQKKHKTWKDSSSSEENEFVKITRQLKVKNLVTITELPKTWTVPRPEDNIAYLLDLSDDPCVWKHESGKSLPMAAIFKGKVLFTILISRT